MIKRLKDIADCRNGYQFRGKVTPDPHGAVRVIQLKDVDSDLRIRTDDLVRVSVERPELYRTEPGDVLFVNRGQRLYAVDVPEIDPDTIATGYFFILRPNPRAVLPEYLAWSLNQPDVQQSLRPYQQGSHMQLVSRADVENVRIRLPPLAVQRQIVRVCELFDRECELVNRIQANRRLLVTAALRKMTHEPQHHQD